MRYTEKEVRELLEEMAGMIADGESAYEPWDHDALVPLKMSRANMRGMLLDSLESVLERRIESAKRSTPEDAADLKYRESIGD